MGRPFYEFLTGQIYCCEQCKTHLSKAKEIISKQFHSKNGRAYLFNSAVNVTPGCQEERMMMSGLHIVCDVYCTGCMENVGWKYEHAYDEGQKYKVGKYVLERAKILEVHDDEDFGLDDSSSSDNLSA